MVVQDRIVNLFLWPVEVLRFYDPFMVRSVVIATKGCRYSQVNETNINVLLLAGAGPTATRARVTLWLITDLQGRGKTG